MSEYERHLIDSGYYDITPEQEKEIEAREECERRGIDPDAICADGGVEAWMVVAKELSSRPVFRNNYGDGERMRPDGSTFKAGS